MMNIDCIYKKYRQLQILETLIKWCKKEKIDKFLENGRIDGGDKERKCMCFYTREKVGVERQKLTKGIIRGKRTIRNSKANTAEEKKK